MFSFSDAHVGADVPVWVRVARNAAFIVARMAA